ncbi:MAG: hypothetical protein WKF48_05810 [Solirubrobacteraceae bacterium]
MSTTIQVTLTLDEVYDPPTASMLVQLNGQQVASRELTPAEAVAALGVLAPETTDLWPPVQAVVERLNDKVKTATSAQTARRKSLKEWQEALAALPPAPDSQ